MRDSRQAANLPCPPPNVVISDRARKLPTRLMMFLALQNSVLQLCLTVVLRRVFQVGADNGDTLTFSIDTVTPVPAVSLG